MGGRLSGVLDIKTLDGDKKKTNYNFTLGLISSKIFINGPIKKDKTSYLISLRKNTFPYLLLIGEKNLSYSFFDVNLKFNTKFKNSSNLSFVFYSSNDAINFKVNERESLKTNFKINWGNIAASMQYRNKISKRVFFDFITGISNYKYKEKVKQEIYEESILYSELDSKFISRVNNLFFNTKLNAFLFEKLEILAGIDLSYQTFKPGKIDLVRKQNAVNSNFSASYISQSPFLATFYSEIIVDDILGFLLNCGFRQNFYSIGKNTKLFFEPRANLSKKIGENVKFEAAYSQVNQFVHLLTNYAGGVSLDYRFAAFDKIKPSYSEQIVVGFSYISDYNDYEFNFSTYFKSMYNLVLLKEGVNFTNNFSPIETLIFQNGEGTSKGIEFLFRKNTGNSSRWFSATFAKTNRFFEGVNNNTIFPFNYDRRVSLTLLFQQKISNRLNISFTWAFATGNPYTLPSAQYTDIDGNTIFIVEGMNTYREKMYHRLDFGLQYELNHKKGMGTLNFSILNLYNRKNPYFLYTVYEKGKPQLYQQFQLPIFPSLSYTYKF